MVQVKLLKDMYPLFYWDKCGKISILRKAEDLGGIECRIKKL